MTRIAYKVHEKSGVIHAALIPANRTGQTRFGLLDGVIVAFFLTLCVGGIVFLLVQ
jgi:hypothetical protein